MIAMKLLFTLLSLLLLVSCTITKRHSGPGYHVEWKKSYSKTESDAEKTVLSDPKTDVPKESESTLQASISSSDSTDLKIQKGEVVMEESETSIKDSEPENDEVIPSLAERKIMTQEPDVVDQPKRKVEPFTWAALGSLFLGLLLLVTIGFAEITFILLIIFASLMVIFSIVSLIRVVRHPELYKGKGLTWTLFMLGMAGTGIALFILIFYLLVITNNVDLL
jgi:hypothetical protein